MTSSKPVVTLDTKEKPMLRVPHSVSIRHKGRAVQRVLSEYLVFKKDHTSPGDATSKADEENENIILAVTGGEADVGDEVSTAENTFLGNVILHDNGTVLIELMKDWVRDAVSNLLKSERGEVCMPENWQGSIYVLKDTPALCHSGHDQPFQIVITGIVKTRNQPFFHTLDEVPIGSLITATQDVAGSRHLPAYGPVHCHLEVDGRRAALISLIHPAIEALQAQDDRFGGMAAFVLAPILQPESDSDPAMPADTEGATGGADISPKSEASDKEMMPSSSKASLSSAEVEIDGCDSANARCEGKDSGYPNTSANK